MAGPGTKLSRHGAHLASCATKFARRGAFTGSPATKFARRGASTVVSAKKFAQRSPYYGISAKKLAQHATNRRFWAVLNSQGELFRAHSHQQTKQGELCTARGAGVGTKLSRLAPRRAQPVQNSPSTPEIPIFDAFCASRENFVSLSPPIGHTGRRKSRTSPHQRAPPPMSHAIRLGEVSTKSENVGIPTLQIHSLKESWGNCMRNC